MKVNLKKMEAIKTKKGKIQLSNRVSEEAYHDLVQMAREREWTISLTLEKAIAEYKKNHFN